MVQMVTYSCNPSGRIAIVEFQKQAKSSSSAYPAPIKQTTLPSTIASHVAKNGPGGKSTAIKIK